MTHRECVGAIAQPYDARPGASGADWARQDNMPC